MPTTKLFKNGNSQAVRIPAELAYGSWDLELSIERQGDELRIRPVARRIGNVLEKLAAFSADFQVPGRTAAGQASIELNEEADRERL